MHDALLLHRFHFAFTITYHYLFPQLTMGLALLIVVLNSLAMKTRSEVARESARFWTRIFAINFVFGVVTGVPMEFQLGTNWAKFSELSGGVIGQTLAMEGLFAFFLESAFLGLLLYGEKLLSERLRWLVALLVCFGSWISGFFIVAANAWMQHPVSWTRTAQGTFQLNDYWSFLLNPWAFWQYAHTMSGAVVTASMVMASLGAFYLLLGGHLPHARLFLRLGVTTGLVFSFIQVFPTGDQQGKMIAYHQPATLAAMEALFRTEQGAPLVLIGQPNMDELKIDNPVLVPRMLSFLTYQRWKAEVKGLDAFPPDQWPTNVPLLYYGYHIMVGLGTLFVAILGVSAFLLWRRRLYETRWMLWVLMFGFPFPYIANTAGWMTAELGRQPWVVHGLIRTAQGASPRVSAGNTLFTLLGFLGLYAVLSLLFLFLIWRQVERGPETAVPEH
jgi:cytochrome bd ubiquinol oxidase subunit I